MSTSQNYSYLHYRYIILLLVFVLIAVVCSTHWCNGSRFSTILSLIATVASILLSVIAIFYTFVSSESLNKVGQSVHEITAIPTILKESIDNTAARLTESASLLQNATVRITDSHAKLTEEQRKLEDMVSSMQGNMDSQLLEIRENLSNLLTSSSDADILELRSDTIKKLLSQLPPAALSVLIAVTLCAQEIPDKSISMQELLRLSDIPEGERPLCCFYMFGVLAMTNRLGLTATKYKYPDFSCRKVSDALVAHLKDRKTSIWPDTDILRQKIQELGKSATPS